MPPYIVKSFSQLFFVHKKTKLNIFLLAIPYNEFISNVLISIYFEDSDPGAFHHGPLPAGAPAPIAPGITLIDKKTDKKSFMNLWMDWILILPNHNRLI